MRREIQRGQEENLDARWNNGNRREEARIGLVTQAEDESIRGQQQRPEQERALLAGPQHGKLVRTGEVPVAVVENVGNGEIIAEGADDEHYGSKKNGGERDDAGRDGCDRYAFRSLAQHRRERTCFPDRYIAGWLKRQRWRSPLLEDERNNSSEERVSAQRQTEQKCKTTNFRHVEGPQLIFSENPPGRQPSTSLTCS